jgi:hypothetical protein
VHAGNPGGTGRGADGTIVKTVKVTKSFLCQLINIWSLGVFAIVATDPLNAVILAGNPENVGLYNFSY